MTGATSAAAQPLLARVFPSFLTGYLE